MNRPAKDLTALLQELEVDKITPEQFQVESAELIASIGPQSGAKKDPVRLDAIDAAASRLRKL
jgi:hypothetical protein